MNVLLVIDSLGSGGAQRQLVNLALGLKEKKYNVKVFIYNTSDNFFLNNLSKNGIKIYYADKYKKFPIFLKQIFIIFNLRKVIKNNIDSIISFQHLPSIYSAFAKIGLGRKKIIIGQRTSSEAPTNIIKRSLFYFSAYLSDAIVTNSKKEKEFLEKVSIFSKKVRFIWNGYKIDSSVKKISLKKKQLKKLLILGRVAAPKNGLNLLKGILIFLERNGWCPEITWVGRKDTDKLSIKMQNQMDSFLNNNPEILSKFKYIKEQRELYKFYHNTDALILPSLYEGLPNVICESMIIGCPVLASSISDNPLILGGGRGLLFNPNSPKSICNVIEMFYQMNINDIINMTQKAEKFAKSNFNLSKMIDKYESLLLK